MVALLIFFPYFAISIWRKKEDVFKDHNKKLCECYSFMVIKLICIPIKVWSVNSYISSAGKMMVKSLRGQASILKAMLLCFFLGNVTMFPALSSLLDS
jgi:hypothetical protein